MVYLILDNFRGGVFTYEKIKPLKVEVVVLIDRITPLKMK